MGGQPQVIGSHIFPHVVEIRGIRLTKTDHPARATQEHSSRARSPAVNPKKKSGLSGAGEGDSIHENLPFGRLSAPRITKAVHQACENPARLPWLR